MASYIEQLQDIVRVYIRSGHPWPASARQVAAWAIGSGLWEATPSDKIGVCANQLARAMREEYITDPQGRKVRVKHVAKFIRDGEQYSLWADMRTATRPHMELAFQQRRWQIVGDCKQLRTDVDSYNENYNPGPVLQTSFNFTNDLEEDSLSSD